jgi:hypothetical protein
MGEQGSFAHVPTRVSVVLCFTLAGRCYQGYDMHMQVWGVT